MKKYDSLQFFKKLGLHITLCKLFQWNDVGGAIKYAEYLRSLKMYIVLRSELRDGDDPGVNCPFKVDISNDGIINVFKEHKDKYSYLIHEGIEHDRITTQGVAYLLPNRMVSIYANEIDKCTCRKAIENPSNDKNVKLYIRDWNSSDDYYTRVRNILVRASLKDDYIICKRIEWTLIREKRYVFWQITDDNKYSDIITNILFDP